MKIRTDFVTNSSSSSFISVGVFDEELAEMLEKYKAEKGSLGLSERTLGGVSIRNGCITITTKLSEVDPWGSYKVNRIDPEYYCSGDVDLFPSDSRKARTLDNIKEAFYLIDIDESNIDKKTIDLALERAYEQEKAIVKVYLAETDSFSLQNFSHKPLIPWNMDVDTDGLITKYSERKSDNGELIFPDSVQGIKRSVLSNLKQTTKIKVNSSAVIEAGLFEDITCLEEVDLSAQYLEILPEGLFKNCTSLKKILLPNELYKIESAAFEGCENLIEIEFPKTISYIEKNAFEGCNSLTQELRKQITEIIAGSAAFEKKVKEASRYIRTHGNSKFTFKMSKFFGYCELFETFDNYKKWHEMYDEYFDSIKQIYKGNYRYVIWGSENTIEQLEEKYHNIFEKLKWRRTKEISGATDFLVVDSNNIPNFERFLEKQQLLDKGDYESATWYGNNLLEKAINSKKQGGKIKIVALDLFCRLLEEGNFEEMIVEEESEEIKEQKKIEKEAKAEKKKVQREAEKSAKFEAFITSVVSKSKELDVLFTKNEIIAMMEEFDISARSFESIQGKTVKEFFVDFGVLKTPESEMTRLLAILKDRYLEKAKPQDVTKLISENSDLDFSVFSLAKQHTGLSIREYLLQEGILAETVEKSMEELTEGVLYKPGEEPDNIKKRIATLFEKLDGAYPDKLIFSLNKDHKKWGETVTDLYRKLGYKSGSDFLTAYGYKMSDEKGGRPKTDHTPTIEEIKRRYPNGANFKSTVEFFEANQDMEKSLIELRKAAPQIFGLTFGKWLESIGLIEK